MFSNCKGLILRKGLKKRVTEFVSDQVDKGDKSMTLGVRIVVQGVSSRNFYSAIVGSIEVATFPFLRRIHKQHPKFNIFTLLVEFTN